MTGDLLDLDAIEARLNGTRDDDVRALIAENRHLRSVVKAALMAEEFQRRRLHDSHQAQP